MILPYSRQPRLVLCRKCGEPFTAVTVAGPVPEQCSDCEVLPVVELTEQQLRAELGMPADTPTLWLNWVPCSEDPEWGAYDFYMFGIPFHGAAAAKALAAGRPPWPSVRLGDGAGGVVQVLQVWLWVVRFTDAPIYAEQRWHPEQGKRISIRGLERRHAQKHLDPTYRGATFFRRLQAVFAGRPKGSGYWPDGASLQRAADPHISWIRRTNARRVTYAALARRMSVDPDTLRDNWKRFGLNPLD